jgi:hypothetical protein
VRVHCYGCPATLTVDGRLPEQGLRIARWATSHGETFCPSCAKQRVLEDPWSSRVPWEDLAHRQRHTLSAAATERVTVPLGPAIEDPRTRSSLRRYGRRGWHWLIAGAVTLLALVVFLGIRSSDATELRRIGRHTSGLVESYGLLSEGGEIRVRYVANGEVRDGRIDVKERYEPGEQVDVIYDPSNASRIRTPQDANESPLATRVIIYGFVFGLGMLFAGIIVLWRPQRWRRFLQTPWQAYVATYIPARTRRSGPGVRLSSVDGAGGQESVLRLSGTLRGRAAKLAKEPVVWAAGDLRSSAVLAIPATRELFAAERPRGSIGRRWLAAQKGPTKRERRAWRVYTLVIGSLSATIAVVLASQHEWLTALLCGVNGAVFLSVFVRSLSNGPTSTRGAPW